MFVGKGIFVNCAVRGSKFIDSSTKALNPTFCEFTSKATFINTVVHNDNEDGNYTFALGTFLVYSTLATDRDDLSGISFSKTKLTANGTPMFRVQSAPDKRPGRAAWEIGYDIAVYDPDYDKTKPWRSFHDYRLGNDGCAKNPPAVLVDGLNDTEHLIPDANGKVRYRMKNGVPKIGEAYGPLCASVDGISIFVK